MLNRFYQDDISNLLLDFIESVLNDDEKLKKKYQLNDFMTSLLLWRALLPTNDNANQIVFPIPPIDRLIPLEHSTWNSSKGGSGTVTRYTYNCQSIVTVRTPQTVVVTRFLLLFAVVMHRVS